MEPDRLPIGASRSGGDMPSEEFHHWIGKAGEWAARYLDRVGELPVLAPVEPGAIRDALPPRAPAHGEPMEAILRDLDEVILPGITHWNHPSFHGYFAVTGSGPGIIGELVAATLNINAMVWKASPAGTELELHVLDWLRDMLGLPGPFFGVIQDTASTSSLVALAAARHRAYPEARESGLFGLPRGRIYASSEAHSSIEKAALALGFGQEGLRKIPAAEDFRMRPDALQAAIARDRESGIRPVAVVATLGTTSTTSLDPVAAIADVARDAGMWLHVDAAYGGAAAILPEFQPHFEGWEAADSIVVNPHKWLFTPVDCSVLYSRDPEAVRGAFSLTPEYLRTEEGDRAVNLMDYGVALGRRFRALKLWMVLRYFGVEGLRERLRAHLEMARSFARRIDEEPGWERMAPSPLATVTFRWIPADPPDAPSRPDPESWIDERNLALMHTLNASGSLFLSHTRVGGRVALRLSVGNLRTQPGHIEKSWEVIRRTAAAMEGA